MFKKIIATFVSIAMFVGFTATAMAEVQVEEKKHIEICELSEKAYVDFIGGAATGLAAGTVITIATVEVTTAVLALGPVLATGTVVAMDPTLVGATLVAATLASGYVGVKAYCNKDEIKRIWKKNTAKLDTAVEKTERKFKRWYNSEERFWNN